jgi:hypothetical protein
VIVAASEKKLKEKFVYCMIFILFQKTFWANKVDRFYNEFKNHISCAILIGFITNTLIDYKVIHRRASQTQKWI